MPPSSCETLRAWLLSALVVHGVVAGNPDAKRLYDDLLSNYNKLVRPVVNTSDVLRVCIKLKLSQLIDVNLKNQIMTTNLWVEQSWYDYKLRWEPKEYGGVHMLHVPSDHIWRPDIVLYNKHHVVEESYNSNFNSDNRGDFRASMEDPRPKSAPVSTLSARINTVRQQLQVLRYQVQKEKRLLEEDRNRMSSNNSSKFQDRDGTRTDYPAPLYVPPLSSKSDATQERPHDGTQLTQPSKRHLEDIERQCDLELNKLQSYLSNIGELKTHWRTLMARNRLGQFHSHDEVTQGIDGEFTDPRVGSKSENYFN